MYMDVEKYLINDYPTAYLSLKNLMNTKYLFKL